LFSIAVAVRRTKMIIGKNSFLGFWALSQKNIM
jgi:hypothetical protein